MDPNGLVTVLDGDTHLVLLWAGLASSGGEVQGGETVEHKVHKVNACHSLQNILLKLCKS